MTAAKNQPIRLADCGETITVKQLAGLTNLSERTIRKRLALRSTRLLPRPISRWQTGRKWLWRRDEVETWLSRKDHRRLGLGKGSK